MSALKKADLARSTINAAATTRAGAAATSILGGVLDLGLNAGLALVTRSPWAIAATVAGAGLLAHQLLKG